MSRGRQVRQHKAKGSASRLLKAGFYIHETSGSHVQLKHPDKPGRVTVPNHQRFDIPKSIMKSIVRQAGLTNDESSSLLDD